jgi:hypothetical protein
MNTDEIAVMYARHFGQLARDSKAALAAWVNNDLSHEPTDYRMRQVFDEIVSEHNSRDRLPTVGKIIATYKRIYQRTAAANSANRQMCTTCQNTGYAYMLTYVEPGAHARPVSRDGRWWGPYRDDDNVPRWGWQALKPGDEMRDTAIPCNCPTGEYALSATDQMKADAHRALHNHCVMTSAAVSALLHNWHKGRGWTHHNMDAGSAIAGNAMDGTDVTGV